MNNLMPLSRRTLTLVKPISSQEQFDRQSKLYAESPIHLNGPSLPYLVEFAQPTGSEFVLDIATGTGSTAFAMAPQVAKVVAIDLAEKMLSQARRLAGERGISNIDFQIGNAESIPFPDHTFDLVTARHAPHHFHDAAAFMREVQRVLKPTGRFVLVDQISLNSEVQEWTNAWEKMRDPSHFYQRTVDEWNDLAERAGLSWIRHTFVPYRMEFNWWIRQAGVTEEGMDKLIALARNASQAESDAVNLEFVGGEVTAFTSQMMVVRMEPKPLAL